MSDPKDNEGARNVQPVDNVPPPVASTLSYAAKDAPKPINDHMWYVRALLVEMRLIRKALEGMTSLPSQETTSKKK